MAIVGIRQRTIGSDSGMKVDMIGASHRHKGLRPPLSSSGIPTSTLGKARVFFDLHTYIHT